MNGNTILVLTLWALVLAAGVAFAIKPLGMWVFTESWKPGSEDGPTKEYLRFARTFGIILAVIGGAMLALTLTAVLAGT